MIRGNTSAHNTAHFLPGHSMGQTVADLGSWEMQPSGVRVLVIQTEHGVSTGLSCIECVCTGRCSCAQNWASARREVGKWMVVGQPKVSTSELLNLFLSLELCFLHVRVFSLPMAPFFLDCPFLLLTAPGLAYPSSTPSYL